MDRRLEYCAAALAVAWCAVGVTGCEAKITEVVVVVDTDLRIPMDLDAIEVRVNTAGKMVPGLDASLTGASAHALPFTLGLRSESDSDTAFNVVVRGLRFGVEQLRATVSTRFVPGERRLLRIFLTADCLGMTCSEADTTCRDGMCRNVYVDPGLLPPLSSFDLGVDAQSVDAGPAEGGPVDGFIDAGEDDAGPVDAGDLCAAGDSGVVGAPPGCVPARPLARPVCLDDGVTVGPLYFGLRDLIIDQSGDRWRTLGWDLDGDCTDALESMPATECEPPAAPAPTDGLNGIDNVFGSAIVPQFLTYAPEFGTGTAGSLASGKGVPIVTLDGWNGLPDDPRVVVSLAYAVDVVPAGTVIPPGGVTLTNTFPAPAWDGTDVAYPSSASFGAGGRSILMDDNAYVAGGMIVARLPDRADLDLPGAAGTVRARVTEFRFSAQLVGSGTALTHALLTGRWPESDMLMFLSDLGICPGTASNDLIRAGFAVVLARSMDVRATPGTGGPGVTCDAVSTVFPFENGVRVTWGEITAVTLPPYACP